jgi:hypothetical protein
MLKSWKVDMVSSALPFSEELERKATHDFNPRRIKHGGRIGKVIVATERTIDERSDELSAFLRAIIRSFWFMRDPDHFEYLRDLELKLRKASHNDEERVVQLLGSPQKVEGWTLPIDLAVPRAEVAETVQEMVRLKQLDRPIDPESGARLATLLTRKSADDLNCCLHCKSASGSEKMGFLTANAY